MNIFNLFRKETKPDWDRFSESVIVWFDYTGGIAIGLLEFDVFMKDGGVNKTTVNGAWDPSEERVHVKGCYHNFVFDNPAIERVELVRVGEIC